MDNKLLKEQLVTCDNNCVAKVQMFHNLEQKYGDLLKDHKRLMLEMKNEREYRASTNERHKYLEEYFKEYIKLKKLSIIHPEIKETREICTQTDETNSCGNCQFPQSLRCLAFKDILENEAYIMKSESFQALNKFIEEIKIKADTNFSSNYKFEVLLIVILCDFYANLLFTQNYSLST